MNKRFRKPTFIANWQMNKTPTETRRYLSKFKQLLPADRWCRFVFCIPSICVPDAVNSVRGTQIHIGAEDCSAYRCGSHTGEIAADMLTDAGCHYVIVGHSQRRNMGDTDTLVGEKVLAALQSGLIPVLCVNDTTETRADKTAKARITMQLKSALVSVPPRQIRNIVLVYEPLGITDAWHANFVCAYLRKILKERYGAHTARTVPILYGGDIDVSSASNIFAQPHIDGAMIGAESLEPNSFMQIIKTAC